MNNIRRISAIIIAILLLVAAAVPAMAQTVDINNGSGTINIKNAAKGETYAIYKLFDATVSADGKASYTGTIPSSLASYFESDDAGNITPKVTGDMNSTMQTALKNWADDANNNPLSEAVSDGSELSFTKLPYGYYIITTTQGNSAITVTSTNPTANVYDKNSVTPTASKKVNGKDVEDASIGDTLTYTATFATANYIGKGSAAEQVKSYTISDTLPSFLSNVTVTGITIAGEDYKVSGQFPQFVEKKIVIPWVDNDNKSLYANGAQIVVTYTAVLTSAATIDGTTGNVNKITLQPNKDKTGNDPFQEKYEDEAKVFTYAAALQKVDQNKKPLAGAKFKAYGLTVGKIADGEYRCVSWDPTSDALGTEMECDAQGQLVILGLKHGGATAGTSLSVKLAETEAPAGYNKLVAEIDAHVQVTNEEITKSSKTIYYDADGKVTNEVTSTSFTKETYNVNLLKTAVVVVNKQGPEMPSTGGMGTTLLYVVGVALVLGAGIVLIARRKAGSKR